MNIANILPSNLKPSQPYNDKTSPKIAPIVTSSALWHKQPAAGSPLPNFAQHFAPLTLPDSSFVFFNQNRAQKEVLEVNSFGEKRENISKLIFASTIQNVFVHIMSIQFKNVFEQPLLIEIDFETKNPRNQSEIFLTQARDCCYDKRLKFREPLILRSNQEVLFFLKRNDNTNTCDGTKISLTIKYQGRILQIKTANILCFPQNEAEKKIKLFEQIKNTEKEHSYWDVLGSYETKREKNKKTDEKIVNLITP